MTSHLLISEPPLQVLPSLATAIGLNEAIVLQQVHYWLNPRFNKNFFKGRHWVYNTYEKWRKQFPFWSEKTVKRTIARLEKAGLLISFMMRDFRRIKYYSINYDLLNEIKFVDSDDLGDVNSRQNFDLEGNFLELPNPLKDDDFPPSGQNGPIEGLRRLDRRKEPKGLEAEERVPDHPEVQENRGSRSSGQNVPLDRDAASPTIGSKRPAPGGQSDPMHRVNLSRSYTENTQEITPHPPPQLEISARAERQEEEEEEENKKIENEKRSFIDSMIEVWNRTAQRKIYPGQAVYLTERREKLLMSFAERVLGPRTLSPRGKRERSELEAWREYCALIANSRFLCGGNGSGFKATLDWALTPANAYKVLEGAIYDKPESAASRSSVPPACPSWEELSQEIARTHAGSPYQREWLQISEHLAKALGRIRYKSWFSKAHLGAITAASAILNVEGRFMKDYIAVHFNFEILRAIQTLYPTVKYVDFCLVSSGGAK